MHCLEISFVTGVLVCLTGVGVAAKETDSCTQYTSCHDIVTKNAAVDKERKAYEIYVGGQKKKVHCEMDEVGSGWTVIGVRGVGSENFDRTWNEYKDGFGNAPDDYWIGNDAIHTLTKEKDQELEVILFGSDNIYDAKYSTFHIGDEDSKYKLTVSGFSGSAGDGLKEHNGMMFTTKDRDYDKLECDNCAVLQNGGWWYRSCGTSNLNDILWKSKKFQASMMLIKPKE